VDNAPPPPPVDNAPPPPPVDNAPPPGPVGDTFVLIGDTFVPIGDPPIQQEGTDAISTAVSETENEMQKAACNQFVRAVAERIQVTDFSENMKANDQIQYMRDHPNSWEKIESEKKAQELANSGKFVVAGWLNPEGHGHVCIVIKGSMANTSMTDAFPSGKAPYVASGRLHNGQNEQIKNESASKAFGNHKPEYFVRKQ
ncbi:MAG: hypothetical protein KGI33_09015, partial [Thaumarchaeota archaeon]|nr:hypothetical protein [Nitrososphaerota archaeon]